MKRLLAAAFAAALIAASCVPGAATPGASPSAAPTGTAVAGGPSTSAAPTASPSHAPLGTVRLALDWTPNTNHTGFYVAAANGWYGDAGVDFRVLPYGTTAPEALVGAGQAECGISFQDALTFAATAGAPIVSVMAILQHTAQEIAVLGIVRPSPVRETSTAGRTRASATRTRSRPCARSSRPTAGKGTFKTVTLDTAAYDALYAKRADFVIMFTAWEGVEARERGIGIRTFAFDDYGFPDFYQVVLACDRRLAGGTARAGARVPRRHRPRPRARGRRSRRGRGAARRPEPGRLRWQPATAGRQPALPGQPGPAHRCERKGRTPDAGDVAGLFGVPVRPATPDRRRWQAARQGARLRIVVHERLPAVTGSGGRLGRWGPPSC